MPGGEEVDINGEDIEKYRVERGPRYLALQHQSFICGKKLLMERWLRSKATCVFWLCIIAYTDTHTRRHTCPALIIGVVSSNKSSDRQGGLRSLTLTCPQVCKQTTIFKPEKGKK